MLTKLIPNIKMLIQKVFKERHHKKNNYLGLLILYPISHFADFEQVIFKVSHFVDFEQVIIKISHQQNSFKRNRIPWHFF